MSEAVSFLAHFPPIQTAIKVGTDGMRIQLDVPETEMVNAVKLLAMRDVILRVTVEVVRRDERQGGTAGRTAAKRRK